MVFRVVTWIITVIIGAVPALCPRCAKTPPMTFTLLVVVSTSPAWGLRDDRIPGTDQAVRGGRHGQKLHSGFPPRQGNARGSADARSSADACLSWQKVQRREANRRRHRPTEPTTRALCRTPPPPDGPFRGRQGPRSREPFGGKESGEVGHLSQ